MKIAICEDRHEDSTRLSALLEKYLSANTLTAEITVFATGEAFLAAFFPGKFDMLFQDIYMDKNGLTGVHVTAEIRKTDEEMSIIFTTTSKEHGPDSYEVNAAYYIVKPVEKANLEKAMDKCRLQLNRYARSMEVMENRRLVKISLRDVCYAEAIRHNSLVHTVSGEIKTRTAFGTLAKKMRGSPFIACHRSFIVNLTHVADMGEKALIMKNGDKVPISKTYQAQAQKAFREYFWES